MQTFTGFVGKKKSDFLVEEIARLMVEMNVEPWAYLIENYKNDSDMVIRLEDRRQQVLQEGWWDNLGHAARKAGGAIGGWLGQTASSGMQTLGTAGKVVRAELFGPEARYRSALSALEALSKELQSNQGVQAAAARDPEAKNLVGELQNIMSQLKKQQEKVSMFNTNVEPATATGASTYMGSKNQPQQAQQQQQGQQAPPQQQAPQQSQQASQQQIDYSTDQLKRRSAQRAGLNPNWRPQTPAPGTRWAGGAERLGDWTEYK